MAVPYTFGSATSAIPLSQLDSNFATAITLGSTALTLGTTTTTVVGLTLTSPTFTTPVLGTPSSGTLTNCTGLPISTGVSGLGTGVATALAVNTGSSGALVINGGALGTPSSGTLTNCTGYPTSGLSGNINLATQVTGTLGTTNGGTGLTSFTSGGVVYASSTSALATGSALTFDGNKLVTNALSFNYYTGSYTVDGTISNYSAGNSLYVNGNAGGYLVLQGAGNQKQQIGISGSNSGGEILFQTNGTERARIDSSGHLLVGTTSATGGIIQAAGDIAVTYQPGGGQTAGFRMGPVGPSTQGMIGYDGSTGNLDISPRDGYAIVFKTKEQGTERARIDSSGNLLVGTTSANGRLTVTAGSAAQSPIATSSVSGDTTYQAILVSKFDNNSTTSQNFIQFQINNGGANCGKITANGANTAAFGSTSDQRVKENIVELPSQLANIMALRPVEYDYLESYGGGHQIGFIAQEMRQVYPDVIAEDDTDEKILSITGWSKTEARLVKAIQEQQALITAQSATIQSLTARLTALENK